MTAPQRVLFVCLGNICRSPSAETVFASRVADAGLVDIIEVDSCGTAGWHVGDRPHRQTLSALARKGYSTSHRGRQLVARDLDHFDVVCVMDAANLADVRRLARTDAQRSKVRLLRSFDSTSSPDAEVPDPYGYDDAFFDEVLTIIERACDGLMESISASR
ncbi:MAG: low molecular weight protein-tyrosine-phosphatase [Acidimicrobiia bacterium]